jgi:hypothetical protein
MSHDDDDNITSKQKDRKRERNEMHFFIKWKNETGTCQQLNAICIFL